MSGKAFIVVGGTGAGKSTFCADCMAKVNKNAIALFDVNNETIYKPYVNGPLPTIEEFTEKTTRLKDAFIVYEEATIFFSNRSSDNNLRSVLVRKRHTNNTVFLVFHSLRNVPRYVYDLCNYVVLFKTNDSPALVESKFDDTRLTECFLRVQKAPQYSHEIFSIY